MLGRVVIGAAAATIAMFVIGFIFFATPLARLGSASLDDTQAAAVQQALAANLPHTGTYFVPDPDGSAAQTVMYGQGPIATVHYNIGGFAAMDSGALIGGLALNFIVALLIGLALGFVADSAVRVRLAVLFPLGATIFGHLGRPVYYHHDWANAVYAFVADTTMLVVAGLILAWFLPSVRGAPADMPTDV
ncbi:MAG: hypothetical protein KF780_00550 [Sphingomonas sp.]|nr:hypothetical protein [Sphingomonas sp.]